MNKWFAVLGAALMAACAPLSMAPSAEWRAVAVTTSPATLGAERAGELRFIGGIELQATDRDFGGLSDIHVEPTGDFLAISDRGSFVRGRIAFDDAGAPLSVRDVAITPMRDENGAALREPFSDSEGMAVLADGRVAVSFEHTQSIRMFSRDAEGAMSAARAGPALADAQTLEGNQGLESIAPDGAGLIVAAEEGDASGAMVWRAPLTGAAPAPVLTRMPKPDGYGVVELDPLPSGDFLAMERFFSPAVGVRIRILRVRFGEGAPSQTLLADLRAPLALDNFEGISVYAGPNGATHVAIVSDNNFNTAQQHTLIYVFALSPPAR